MNNRNKSLLDFNPSSIGIENGNLYGLPYFYENSGIIVFGIPWEVTVSYKTGTGLGPLRVLEASPQLDLYDLDNPHGWKQGIFMPSISQFLLTLNQKFRKKGFAQKLFIVTANQGLEEGCEMIWSIPRKTALKSYTNFGFETVGGYIKTETSDSNIYVKMIL